jgi:cell wall-associated NlpC family hydrolase
VSAWSNGYIGIPWKPRGRDRDGCDCWGLIRLVYGEELNLSLPSYADDYAVTDDRGSVAALFADGKTGLAWSETKVAEAFDLALFRVGGFDTHVGIVVSAELMLHVDRRGPSRLERWEAAPWVDRLTSFWRYIPHARRGMERTPA